MRRLIRVATYARFRGIKKLMDSGMEGPIMTFAGFPALRRSSAKYERLRINVLSIIPALLKRHPMTNPMAKKT